MRRILWIMASLAAAALIFFGVAALLGWAAPAAPPARNPFGVGAREAAPAVSGIAGQILAMQSQFFRALTLAVKEVAANPWAGWSLIGLSLAYGVFHAAGPGHGKAVIAAYIVADGSSLKRAFALSLAAAMVQAGVAILLVTAGLLVFRATALDITAATTRIEIAAFAALALIGLWVLWRKSAQLAALTSEGDAAQAACDHFHLPGPETTRRLSWREGAGIALAAGARPCMGTIIVLTFAASQGLWLVGLSAAIAIALGVAITTGALAALAALFKSAALGLAGGRGMLAARIVAALECLAAACVALLGFTLLLGLASGWGPS
jgi:nickel/cobalt transporter (NicO) family protein